MRARPDIGVHPSLCAGTMGRCTCSFDLVGTTSIGCATINSSGTTTTTKRTRSAGTRVRAKADIDRMTPQMWARLRTMTNDEVLAAARKDPDAGPLEDRDPTSLRPPRHL